MNIYLFIITSNLRKKMAYKPYYDLVFGALPNNSELKFKTYNKN